LIDCIFYCDDLILIETINQLLLHQKGPIPKSLLDKVLFYGNPIIVWTIVVTLHEANGRIVLKHVLGHTEEDDSASLLNQMADTLCRKARHKPNFIIDIAPFLNINTHLESLKDDLSVTTKPVIPIEHSKPDTPIEHSKPDTPIEHSKQDTPIEHSKQDTPIEHSKQDTPIEHSKPDTPMGHSKYLKYRRIRQWTSAYKLFFKDKLYRDRIFTKKRKYCL